MNMVKSKVAQQNRAAVDQSTAQGQSDAVDQAQGGSVGNPPTNQAAPG